MHILFLTQVLPFPLDAGPKLRAYYVLRWLVEQGHRVTLVSFVRPEDTDESLAQVRSLCRQAVWVPMTRRRIDDLRALLMSLCTGQPLMMLRDRSPAMAARLRAVCREWGPFDAIHADQLAMAPFALAAHAALGRTPRLVLDQHNAVFSIYGRLAAEERNPVLKWLWRRESRACERSEARLLGAFDWVAWVSPQDQAKAAPLMAGHVPEPRQLVIPIAVDPERRGMLRRSETPSRITFLGGLHWPPNAAGVRWFAGRVWPRIRHAVPAARFTVIGKRAGRHRSGRERPNRDGIQFTGYVADPTQLLADTAVFVVPLLAGGGVRVKILDAWSWGLPVVSTTVGAEGLRAAEHGRNLLIADDAEAFAAAVLAVYADRALAERLVAAGRRTVAETYHWRTTYRAWEAVYPPAH